MLLCAASSGGAAPAAPARRRLAIAALALAALPTTCRSQAFVGARKVPREWDELRMSEAEPSKVATPLLNTESKTNVFGLGRTFHFEKDWLRIEGAANDDNFDSYDFEFVGLDHPHEWCARVLGHSAVRLRVGKKCECTLDGIAAYTQSDDTAWLRLQFDGCRHCESTATRAAVVMPVARATTDEEEHTSNLHEWMCAVSDHAACHGPPTTRTSTTATTKAWTTTTTLPPPKCRFEGSMSVRTIVKDFGLGRCLTDGMGARNEQRQAPSIRGCQIACDLSYTTQAAGFTDVADIKAHIDQINTRTDTCKGYAYNEKTKTCAIYYGANNSYDYADNDPDWHCFGNVHVDEQSFKYETTFGTDCTTNPPTVTSTTRTTTTITETTTTTRERAILSLKDLFSVQPEEGTVFNMDETRFPRRDLEATLLQLQSDCYLPIDYYLLGKPLPVAKKTWPALLDLMKTFGDASAWPPGPDERKNICPASVTVDRLPVDADVSGRADTQMGEVGRGFLRFLLPLLMGILATGAALFMKSKLYPQGLDQHVDMAHAELAGVVIAACFAGLMACFIIFWLGQFIAWFFRRIAVKAFAMGMSSAYPSAPVLSAVCLPTAITAGSATLVLWLWPKDEQPQQVQYMQKELQISYDTMTGEMTHYIS